ncbi:MAG: histidine kinase dimerization/phosphoacceptor domain-containing protein, partial [Dokdonella sp.]
MRDFVRQLVQPLHLALLLTWVSVGLSLGVDPEVRLAECWALLVVFLVASFLCDLPRLRSGGKLALIAVEALAALALIWLTPRSGAAPVLLVVLAAQLSMMWPLRRTLLTMLAIDVVFFLIVREAGYRSPLLVVLIYSGFQAFALLVGHYASRAEHARDQLALVNADLLATRALLADSARNAERLRMARELHDVAGHKLTAMMLNLRALGTDPLLAGRDEVRVAQ